MSNPLEAVLRGTEEMNRQQPTTNQGRELAQQLQEVLQLLRQKDQARSDFLSKIETATKTLNDRIGEATKQVSSVAENANRIRRDLDSLRWDRKLMFGPAIAGGLAALIVGAALYFGVLGELRSNAELGRKFSTYLYNLSPKDKERLLKAIVNAEPAKELKWWWPF